MQFKDFTIPKWNEWGVDKDTGVIATEILGKHIKKSLELYDDAIRRGVSEVKARMFLPESGYQEGVEDAIEFVLEWGEKHPHAKLHCNWMAEYMREALLLDGRQV